MQQKRIEWVDTARFFAMIAVMANHTQFMTAKLDSFVAPCYLNMFSFAAGYVYVHRAGFAAFFRKKLRQLFLPWLCLSLLVIVLGQIFSFHDHAPLGTLLLGNFLQIHYRHDEMWYVAALFAAFLPFYFLVEMLEKGGRRRGHTLTLLAAVFALAILSDAFVMFVPPEKVPGCYGRQPAALPWHLEYLGTMLFYMLLGYLFRGRAEERFDRHKGPWQALLLFALYCFVNMVLPWKVGGILGVPRLFFQHLCALLSLAALISLSKLLPSNAFVRTIGQNTILYYGLHGKAESLVQHLLVRVWPAIGALRRTDLPQSAAVAVALALVIGLLLLPVIAFIRRYLPFLAGKSRPRPAD